MSRKKEKETRMALWEHLEELRWTIFRILGVLLLTTLFSILFIDEFLAILMRPVETLAAGHPEFVIKKIMTSPFDGIIIKMKTSLIAGIVFGFPFMIYFIWKFVSSGLKAEENRAFILICTLGTVLFFTGTFCGYLLITPLLAILMKMGIESTANYWTVREYINFTFYWLLGAGLIWELPLAIIIITRLGIIDVLWLRKIRPYFVVGAFIFAAVITPPDPFSMMMVGIPLIILFEFGITAASLYSRQEK
jgi:sec-independent protein translocase protein TatC